MSLQGKSVVVTGSAKGIGRYIAQGFAQEGAKVAIMDIDEARLQQTLAEIEDFGGEAMAVNASVRDEERVRSAMAEVGHDAALLIDPTAVGSIADGLAALLDDEPLRERLRGAGLHRAASLRWPTVAERTVAIYDRVVAAAGAARTRLEERPA